MSDIVERPLQDRLKQIFDDAGGSDELVELLKMFDFEGSRELADAITLACCGQLSNDLIEAQAARIKALEEVLIVLQGAEWEYRHGHDLYGDGSMEAGRAWDQMRRAGDKARIVLAAWEARDGQPRAIAEGGDG